MSVSLLVTTARHTKKTELIRVPFGLGIRGTNKHVLDEGRDLPPPGEGAILCPAATITLVLVEYQTALESHQSC